MWEVHIYKGLNIAGQISLPYALGFMEIHQVYFRKG